MSYFREQLEDYLKTLDIKADRVLDIGGAQLPVKKRTRSWDVRDYKILDLKEPHKGSMPDLVQDINHPFDCRVIPGKMAEVCFCLEVMEYLWHPVMALSNIAKMMEPGGTLYISFPFVYPQHKPTLEDRMRYTRRGAEFLVSKWFDIQEVIPRYAKNPDVLRAFYSAEGMRAANDADHAEVGYIIKATKKI